MKERRKVAPTIFLALMLLFLPYAASAHTSLLTQTPLGNSTVIELPKEIELVFDEELMDFGDGNNVVVTAPNGVEVTKGKAKVVSSRLIRTMSAATINGKYTVEYRVVSADGHVVEGTYAFNLESKGAPSSEPSTSETQEASVDEEPTFIARPLVDSHNGVMGFIKHHLDHIYLTLIALTAIGGWWFFRKVRAEK
jgi:methionine-rich copper-binding protein CopC